MTSYLHVHEVVKLLLYIAQTNAATWQQYKVYTLITQVCVCVATNITPYAVHAHDYDKNAVAA